MDYLARIRHFITMQNNYNTGESLDYIKEIRQLAEMGKGRFYRIGNHKKSFEKPATMQEIREFEQEMCVTLPIPLVRYLTELGNGGVGADYGIYSLSEMRKHNPNSAQNKDLPVMLDHSLTEQQWNTFFEKYASIYQQIEQLEDSNTENIDKLYQILNEMESQLTAGGIFISTPGCTMDTLLMCRGNASGEVFMLDFDCMADGMIHSEPWCGGKFENWIIKDMHKQLERK